MTVKKNRATSCLLCVLCVQIALLCIAPKETHAAAVDRVICVPWQGDVAKYHTTWDSQAIILKCVVHTADTSQTWYKWNFGDGSESAVMTLSGQTQYNVETVHAYAGAQGTPFTAQLLVANNDVVSSPVTDTYLVKIEAADLDSKINVAIDNGLWYLYKAGSNASSYYHTFDASPFMVWSYDGYFASPTASAVQAFEINGHKETGNPNEDPYVEMVARGLNWLFTGWFYDPGYAMLQPMAISPQHGDDPDSNGDGLGIEVRDYYYRPVYEGGMVMDAIIAAGTPNADSGRDFNGDGVNDTYREVVQNMIDAYAFGQYDGDIGAPYGIIGGWRYNWQDWPDNSACQWGAIGMIPAQHPPWNLTVPDWVKTYNNNWLNYSHYEWNWDGTQNLWGGFGYTGPSWGVALTPSGMVQLSFAGNTTADPRWVRSERWFADNWNAGTNWINQNNVYAYYAFAKAMRLAQPSPVTTFAANNFDWYRGDGITQGLAEKIADQLVTYSSWDYYGPILGTSWSVIILKPVLFAEAPIACFDTDPNPSYPDIAINFDPGCSGHSEADKDIGNLIQFAWDWNNDGVYDTSTTGPDILQHAFACASLPCAYPVQLRVTDDSDPARTATYVKNVVISNPPHPPVANLVGPYLVSYCAGDTLTLDGARSYDPNEGQHEQGCETCPNDTVTAWNWDLHGAPWNYTDASGAVLNLGSDFATVFTTAGNHDIGLQVTDNTLLSYPNSGQPNLTDQDFSVVNVYEGCICELSAQPGCNYVHLSWDNIGADHYVVYRSTTGSDIGFEDTSVTTDNFKDLGSFVMGQTTYYRVMAVTGESRCMSKAIAVTAPPELCNPTADPKGPYQGCIGVPVTLDGSGSTAQTGTVVGWEWDLDGDGQYDDALGQTTQTTWNAAGVYPIGLKVVSSDNLVLTDTGSTTATISNCTQEKSCDVNGDGAVNILDINIINAARNTVNPALDIDSNGVVNVLDSRKCVLKCNKPRCAQ